jgi:hypothetical protein
MRLEALKSIKIQIHTDMLSHIRHHYRCSYRRNPLPLAERFHLHRLERISSGYQFDMTPNSRHCRRIS